MTDSTESLFERFVVHLAAARVALLFLVHAVVFIGCFVLATLVRFEFALPHGYLASFTAALPIVVAIQLLFGFAFGFYQGWWRYVGMSDVIRLSTGISTASLVVYVLWHIAGTLHAYPAFAASSRGVLVVDWAFSLLTLFGARVIVRVGRDRFRNGKYIPERKKRVLILGAGDAGEALAREIEHRPQLGLMVVGFVDDEQAKWGSHIRSIPVKGPIADVAAIAADHEAIEALIAMPSAAGPQMRKIVHHLAASGLTFRTIPGLDQLATGKAQVANLRAVNVDDLLRRKEIVISEAPVKDLFSGSRIVITGGGGSIGSELVFQTLKYAPEELHVFERSELALYQLLRRIEAEAPQTAGVVHPHLVDCADAAGLVQSIRPAIVIHAAAHKHVPLGEQNPAEYVRNNCLVARSFAQACAAADVDRFIFISTDKAINPASVMGASKRAAEIALLNLGKTTNLRVMVVRFGNVIGSSGSVVPLFVEQIANGGPVTITHPDTARYFLRSSEAISLVLQTVAFGKPGRVYMLDMGDPIRIADLARDLIQLSNHTLEDIPIVYTGLRPGEKLEEEICATAETSRPTQHPHVFMMDGAQPDAAAVARWFWRLDAAVAVKSPALRTILRELIAEYEPSNPVAGKTPERGTDLHPAPIVS